MGIRDTRKFVVRIFLITVAAAGMIVGSYALVGRGDDYAIGEGGASAPTQKPESTIRGTVVSRIRNAAELPSDVDVISVPLGVNFQQAGMLYGGRAKAPIKLGPKNVKGMTQDGFGTAETGVLLPDGRLIYHFWQVLADFPTYKPGDPEVPDGTHMATPTIRVLNLASGEDSLLLTGARSMAWSADGRFAYAKGVDDDYRLNVPYLERVTVMQGLNGEPQTWTSDADRYTVLQWAGDSLLVYREVLGGARELLAFDGPDSSKTLLSEADGEAFLGISPDGTKILAGTGMFGAGEEPLMIKEIDWRTGREVASLSLGGVLDPVTDRPIEALREAAWQGDRVIVTLNSASVAIMSAAGESLVLEDLVTFQYQKLGIGPVNEPMLDQSGTELYVVADEGADPAVQLERTAVLGYDLASGECTRWIVPGTAAMTRMVSNPSRPN